jgi:hypothetical protein
MQGRTKTKYNSCRIELLHRTSRASSVLVLASSCLVFVGGEVRPVTAAPQADQFAASVEVRSEWMERLWHWLSLWSRYTGCAEAAGEEPAVWLMGFNQCWDCEGLPDDLTHQARSEMLSILDGLEAHLLTGQDRFERDLFDRTIRTIGEARTALRAPLPEPEPNPAIMPGSAAANGGGA